MPASAITMGGTADHDGAEWAITMSETCIVASDLRRRPVVGPRDVPGGLSHFHVEERRKQESEVIDGRALRWKWHQRREQLRSMNEVLEVDVRRLLHPSANLRPEHLEEGEPRIGRP
jgi:hypothetical protein